MSEILKNRLGFDVIKNLEIEVPVRGQHNSIYDESTGTIRMGNKRSKRIIGDKGSVKKFAQTLHVAELLKRNLESNLFLTKRGVFYTGKTTQVDKGTLFNPRSQIESDEILEDIEALLGISRENLNVVEEAEKKSFIGGDVIYTYPDAEVKKGVVVGWKKTQMNPAAVPVALPLPDSSDFEIIDTSAKFVLVIEKFAIFKILHKIKWWDKMDCILLTGSGQPDRSARRMAKKLGEFGLPVFVICDSDPYGLHIYSVYKVGSFALPFASDELCNPKAMFLGVNTSDIEKYKLQEATEKATPSDIRRAQEIKKLPWFKDKKWQDEIDLFIKLKIKTELDSFVINGIDYLWEKYIPDKIKEMMP